MNVNNSIVLNRKDIFFSPVSVVDEFGRVFFYTGRVFRAIDNQSKDACLTLLNSPLFDELSRKGYIPRTWISEFQMEGSELVIEHEWIYESKPHHWSYSMFKDAALFLLELQDLCSRYDYQLKDAHPFNVFFRENKPVFIDFGSFMKRTGSSGWRTSAYEEFISTYYIPLLLWSHGEYFMARRLIEDGIHPVLRTIPMNKVLDARFIAPFSKNVFDYTLYFRGKRITRTKIHSKSLSYSTKLVNAITCFILNRKVSPFSYRRELKPAEFIKDGITRLIRPPFSTFWADYHNDFKIGSDIVSTARFDRIIELIGLHASDSKSALDLAGNQGAFCYLLSQRIDLGRIVLTDYDENAIDKAYAVFKGKNIPIEAYLFNFMKPLRIEEVIFFKSDIVFSLAITHHLILKQKYLLPVIFERISKFSNKYVVIEFMPLGLWSKESNPEVPDWYTEGWFIAEFQQYFEILVKEEIAKNRILFLGRKLQIDDN